MTAPLLQILPTPEDLLALEPEDLAGVLIEVLPALMQEAGVTYQAIDSALYPPHAGGPVPAGYPQSTRDAVGLALAEALSWMETQGLLVRNPGQPGVWYVLTRRGQKLRNRADLQTYRLGRTLPIDLLPRSLADKVHGLYLRGDYETAVFQAFKMVEVDVRRAAGCEPDEVGVKLMRKAFDPRSGRLAMQSAPVAEREAISALFAGAIGYAKNPPSHRDVKHSRQSAARLILFASELLEIVFLAEILG
jgi:uncharacterized protein (TIGR02391 family)